MPRRPALALDVERPARITRHDWRRAVVDLPAYAAVGLPAETMGRGLTEDPLFFGAALAGGAALAELAVQRCRDAARRARPSGGSHGQGAVAADAKLEGVSTHLRESAAGSEPSRSSA